MLSNHHVFIFIAVLPIYTNTVLVFRYFHLNIHAKMSSDIIEYVLPKEIKHLSQSFIHWSFHKTLHLKFCSILSNFPHFILRVSCLFFPIFLKIQHFDEKFFGWSSFTSKWNVSILLLIHSFMCYAKDVF